MGPFSVIKPVGEVAYRLQLPEKRKIHPTVHVSKLRRFEETSEFGGRDGLDPPPVLIDNEEEYVGDFVIDHRGSGKNRQYLISGQGYDRSHNSWEPYHHLVNCSEKLREYFAARRLQPTPEERQVWGW